MSINYLDLRDLASELADLQELEIPEEDEAERLAMLVQLEKDLGGDLDAFARNEPTAIADADFTEYAQELAKDIGAIDRYASWPYNCIDWEQAAADLSADYTNFDFDGTSYLVRA